MTTYLFGDTEVAARRLGVLARVFAESTRGFLAGARALVERPRLALDLGCGPGYSTQCLADALDCDQAVGLDNSPRFVSATRKAGYPRCAFRWHDVTSVPFPVGPGDVIYCRFLLSHLEDPAAAVRKWATQLRPGGLLLMEEVEWIRTAKPTFTTYIRIVEQMLENQGKNLYVGPALDALAGGGGRLLRRRSSRVRRLKVSNGDAAAMFFLNMQTWKEDPFVEEHYPRTVVFTLYQELYDLAQQETATRSEIEWGLRQVALERT